MERNNDDTNTADEGLISRARVIEKPAKDRFVVLVANAKGGCGKTTLSTNLASYYANSGLPVSLLDMDPQQSSSMWLRQREAKGRKDIHGLALPIDSHFSAGKLHHPLKESRDYLVVDSPAGLNGAALDALLQASQVVLVPVLPSPIDIRAATRFLQSVMLSPAYQRRPRRIAVIANRARERTRMYAHLQHFLNSLKIPFLVTLRDTQIYVQATGLGIGIAEMKTMIADDDRDDWRRVIEWLEVQRHLTRAMPGFH